MIIDPALYDSTGTLFATYDYDAWGKLLSIRDASGNLITDSDSFAIINPIRYRGYYYDTESGLYYLQSRHYDPETGRFISSDEPLLIPYLPIIGSISNLFVYCNNCPVILSDRSGYLTWFGEIHQAVVEDIHSVYGYEITHVKVKYKNGGYGRCDVINLKDGSIWEVKKSTVSRSKALKQIKKYTEGTYVNPKTGKVLPLKAGNSKSLKGRAFTFKSITGDYYFIKYWNAGAGIIYYQYEKTSKRVLDEETAKQAVYALAAYYTFVTILTFLTSGATSGLYLLPV